MGTHAFLAIHMTGVQQVQIYFENGETPAFYVVFPARRWGNYEQLEGGILTS